MVLQEVRPLPFRVSIAPSSIMGYLQDCLMPTQLLSQSEAFTGMTALRGSSVSMQFLSYLKNLTPLCENKPEMISLARIRLRYRKQNPAYAGCSAIWAALVGGFPDEGFSLGTKTLTCRGRWRWNVSEVGKKGR